METLSRLKRSRFFKWIPIVIIAILAVSFLAYLFFTLYLYMQTGNLLQDPENDVVLNIGEEYPGMIDVDKAVLDVNGTALNITITMKDIIRDLDDGEYAQYNVTLILESDPIQMFELCAQLNSTMLLGYGAEIGGSSTLLCHVEYHENSLTLSTFIGELQTVKEVQWFILTTFEKSSEGELLVAGSDIAPDEGLQTTTIEK